VINGDVTVATGGTLTLQPGVVVKFNGTSRSLFINGVLNAVGTPSNPIYFTSAKDDSVGGDTLGDGPTTGTAGDWGQLKFANGSALSQLSSVVARYGGKGSGNSNAEIYVNGATSGVTLSDSAITDSQTTGIDVYLGSSSITRATFQRNAKAGVYVDHGHVAIDHSTLTGNAGWGADLLINSAPYPSGSTFYDSTITTNGAGGIRMWGGAGTPQGTWPFGNRNRIFGNNSSSPSGNQLYNIGLSHVLTVDWSGNYWGPGVEWTTNAPPCGDTGYLALKSGGAPTPLFWWGVFPGTDCYVNVPSLDGGPINVQPPYISGFANVGEVVTAAHGDWTNGTPNFQYQWQRCDKDGASCIDLFGQTGPNYVVDQADLDPTGKTLRVRVTATNTHGSTSATSKPSPIVVAPFQTLALRFRPALLFHKGSDSLAENERWRPLDVPTFLSESHDSEGGTVSDHVVCNDHQGGTCSPLWSAADLDSHSLGSAYIDVPEDIPGPAGGAYDKPHESHCPGSAPIETDFEILYDCDSGPSSAIYYEPGQDDASYRYLDYWWFIRQNDVSAVEGAHSVDNHVGDWEGATVVLDPIDDATNPVVSHVLYAVHSMTVWVTGNALPAYPSAPERPEVFVANGTHASYQFPCSEDCHQPEGSLFSNEAPHDGLAGWANNDDAACGGACVHRFPSSGWPYWPGRWGPSVGCCDPPIGEVVGWSPKSPGLQGRFMCAQNGRSDGVCTRPPGSREPERLNGRAPRPRPANARDCQGWFGFGVAALACDPVTLRKALRQHTLTRRWTLHLAVKGRRGGDSPGIAQVLGEPLTPGERAVVTGSASLRSILLLQIRVGQRRFILNIPYAALDHRRTRVLQIQQTEGRPFVTMHGRRLQAKFIR
jgi:hypothetical protein